MNEFETFPNEKKDKNRRKEVKKCWVIKFRKWRDVDLNREMAAFIIRNQESILS